MACMATGKVPQRLQSDCKPAPTWDNSVSYTRGLGVQHIGRALV